MKWQCVNSLWIGGGSLMTVIIQIVKQVESTLFLEVPGDIGFTRLLKRLWNVGRLNSPPHKQGNPFSLPSAGRDCLPNISFNCTWFRYCEYVTNNRLKDQTIFFRQRNFTCGQSYEACLGGQNRLLVYLIFFRWSFLIDDHRTFSKRQGSSV